MGVGRKWGEEEVSHKEDRRDSEQEGLHRDFNFIEMFTFFKLKKILAEAEDRAPRLWIHKRLPDTHHRTGQLMELLLLPQSRSC